MKRAGLTVLFVALLALLLVSCESYEPPGVENASPVGPTNEGYLVPEEELGSPEATDCLHFRPITEFTEAQATESHEVWPFGDVVGWSGHPPGWSNPWTYPYWVYFDWANLVGPWLYEQQGINLGTQISGFVTEQSLLGGGRRVNVMLYATNAWTIANICDFELGPVRWPIVLGYAPEHIFQSGETPLKSQCTLNLKWRDSYGINGPLPNLLEDWFGGVPWPDLYVERLALHSSSGIGSLTYQPEYPELTPWETGMSGRVMVHQIALDNLSTWPLEICNVFPVENP